MVPQVNPSRITWDVHVPASNSEQIKDWILSSWRNAVGIFSSFSSFSRSINALTADRLNPDFSLEDEESADEASKLFTDLDFFPDLG